MSVGRTAKSRIAAILCSESFRQIPLELGKDVCQSVAASGTRFAVSVAGIVLCIRIRTLYPHRDTLAGCW